MAFDAFALILAMLALGMLFARLDVLPDSAAETLNRVVLYVCLPAAVLIAAPVGLWLLLDSHGKTGRPSTRLGVACRFTVFGGLLAAAMGGAAHGLHAFPAPQEMRPFDYHLVWHERSDGDAGTQWLVDALSAGFEAEKARA